MVIKPLLQWLLSAVPVGTVLPIVRGPLRGMRWIAGSTPGGGKGLSVLLNHSEPLQLRKAGDLVRPGDVCFDIGAHVGIYSLAFSRKAKHVLAFEPLPLNIGFLQRHLALNHITNVTIVPFAVSGRTAITSFQEGTHSSEGRLDPTGSVPVFSVTLDDFVKEYHIRPSVLKIDVEGIELELLQGAAEYLSSVHPALLLSTHSDALRSDSLRILKEYGYCRVEPLDHPDPEIAREFAVCG